MSNIFSKKSSLYIIGILIGLILLFWILPYSIPLIFALITAFLLEPIVKMIQKKVKKKSRHIAVIIVFVCFLSIIGVSTYFLSTKVVGEVIHFVEKAPLYINKTNDIWTKIDTKLYKVSKNLPPDFVAGVNTQVEEFLNLAKEDITSSVNIDKLKSIFTNIPIFLVSFLVYLIALFLFLLDLPNIKERIYTHLTTKTRDKVNFMTSRLSFVIFGFFKAQFLVSIIIFLVSLIALLFIVPKVAIIMSIIIWIIDVIPIVGSIIILAPWASFYLLTGNIALGTKLGILAVILIIIRRVVEPKVMGSHIGLSPLTTLIAMYLGLKLFGLLGFIVGPFLLIAFNSAREAGLIKLNFKL